MKIRYFVTDSGKIIKRYNRKSNKLIRKRLRKYREYINDGIATIDLPLSAMKTWIANQKKCNLHKTILSMLIYFYKLYGDEYEQEAKALFANGF